jgi:hypothetical protein
MEKSLFVDFCQIFENKKSKSILTILKDFQKRSSTKCYQVLLSTTKRGRDF